MPEIPPTFTVEHRLAWGFCVSACFVLMDAIAANWPDFVPVLAQLAGLLFVLTLCVVILRRD